MNIMCDEANIQTLVDQIQQSDNPDEDLLHIDKLLPDYPQDPRLHFLRGSVLVGAGKHIEAHASYTKAIEIAPDFAIARFQLGFFELTSGEAERSIQTLTPLLQLPDDHYLKVFSLGLFHLIRDEFDQAIAHFRKGIQINQENLPLNGDMKLLLDECIPLAEAAKAKDLNISETSLILNQFSKTSGTS